MKCRRSFKRLVLVLSVFASINSYVFFDCFSCKAGDPISSFSLIGLRLQEKENYFNSLEFLAMQIPWKRKNHYIHYSTIMRMPYGFPVDVLIGPRMEMFISPNNFRLGVVAENTMSITSLILNKVPIISQAGFLIPLNRGKQTSYVELLFYRRWMIELANYVDGPFYAESRGIYFGFKTAEFF